MYRPTERQTAIVITLLTIFVGASIGFAFWIGIKISGSDRTTQETIQGVFPREESQGDKIRKWLNIAIKTIEEKKKEINRLDNKLSFMAKEYGPDLQYIHMKNRSSYSLKLEWRESYDRLKIVHDSYNSLVSSYNSYMSQTTWRFSSKTLPKEIEIHRMPRDVY